MKPLRVLEAITPSRIGGAEVFVANLARSLIAQGAEVELFCPAGRPFIDYAAAQDLKVITWKTRGKLDPITLWRLRNLIKARRFDVVHTHLSTASLLGALAAKLARRPSVAHVHGFNTATCFRYSSLLIAVSEAVKRHLTKQGIDEAKVAVVCDGVDIAALEPVDLREAKARLGLDPEAPLLGMFGRLSPEKGQRVALEAMYLLLQDYPLARLVIAGEGRDRADLEQTARALDIADRVRFAGFTNDVRAMMSACDVVLVPSLREGLGLAAVEAMALERPVVASMVGGLPEIVDQRETGILVAPEDPRALAQAVGDLLGDPALAESMGRRGRKVARERFDLTKQTGEVYRVLRGAVTA